MITPDPATNDQTLVCSASVTDAGGVLVTLTYAWKNLTSSAAIGSAESLNLDSSLAASQDTIGCTITATDTAGGTSAASVSIVLDNRDPEVTALIEPDSATHADTLICSAVDAQDADDDETTVTFSWTVDDVETTETASDEGSSSLGGVFVSGQAVSCLVTVEDGKGGTASDQAELTLGNTTPEIAAVSISPEPAYNTDTLTCTIDASDGDGDALTEAYVWTNTTTGAELGTEATVVLTTETASPNDTIECSGTVTDPYSGTTTSEASVVLSNRDPEVAASLTPEAPLRTDTLVCTVDSATDQDDDSLSAAISWTVDGTAVEETSGEEGSTSELSDAFVLGQTVVCTVEVTDEHGAMVSTSNEVVIGNTGPVIAGVTISPETATNSDTLTCTADASDIDEEALVETYTWTNTTTGEALGSESSVVLSSATASPNDTIECHVLVADPSEATADMSASIVLDNRDPVVSLTLTPELPQRADTIVCAIDTIEDADDDSLTVAFSWTVDGVSVAASAGDESSSEVADVFISGQTVTCMVEVTDEHGAVTTATEEVVVENTGPVMVDVQISPDPANNSDTLICTADVSDIDDDDLVIEYTWSTGHTGSELALSSSIAASGDTLSCTVIVSDTSGETAEGVDTITLLNRDPVLAISISPAASADGPTSQDVLVCSATEMYDPDDDDITLSLTWTVDGDTVSGTPVSDTAAILSGVFAAGQTVTCEGIVVDSKEGTASSSDSVVIVNIPPEILEVSTYPDTIYTNDVFAVSADVSDDDGDELTVTYAFSVDGEVVQEGEREELDGAAWFDKHQTIVVTVTADDGTDTVTRSTSPITVQNTPPQAPDITLGIDGSFLQGQLTRSLDSGGDYFCALDSDGVIECWGSDADGVIRNQPEGSGYRDVSAGHHHACAINDTNEIECWGNDEYGKASPPAGRFLQVSAGYTNTCAINDSNEIECWGNSTGSIPSDGGFAKVATGGHYHACGLSVSGNIECWGSDSYGQVSGVPDDDFDPDGSFADVEVGLYHSCALHKDGRVSCWGSNPTGHDYSASVPSSLFKQIESYWHSVCGVNIDDEIECWGQIEIEPPSGKHVYVAVGNEDGCTITRSGTLEFFGDDAHGEGEAPEDYSLPATDHGLMCSVDSESSDADGDDIEYSFYWDVDGTEFTDTDTAIWAGDLVSYASLGYDEEWTCTVTPYDDDDYGDSTVSDTVITPQGLIEDCLVAQYDFEDGSGSVLRDSSGNGYHGILGTGIEEPSWMDGYLEFFGDEFGGSGPRPGTCVTIDTEAFNLDNWTVQVVYRAEPQGSQVRLLRWDGSRSGQIQLSPGYPDSTDWEFPSMGFTGGLDGDWHVLTYTNDPVASRAYINSTHMASGGTQYAVGSSPYILLGGAGCSNDPFNGDIAYFLVYDCGFEAEDVAVNVKALDRVMSTRGHELSDFGEGGDGDGDGDGDLDGDGDDPPPDDPPDDAPPSDDPPPDDPG